VTAESRFCTKCGKPLSGEPAFCPSCGAPVSSAGPAQTQAPLSGIDAVIKESAAQNYWVRRLAAFVIDAVIVYVALGILALLFAISFLLASGLAAFGVVLAGVFSFVAGVILVLYFTFAEAYAGATVGKRVFGLKVVVAGGARSHPPFVDALLRNISKIYWLLLLLDVIVGLAVSKGYTQKYSDKVVGTEVV
jgi:uncharacterized RDD family membrane protein YckC